MLSSPLVRCALRHGAVLTGLIVVASCGDGPSTSQALEPQVQTMRLIAGTQTITVNRDDETVTGGPILLPSSGSVAVTAEFLRESGLPDPIVTSTTFHLDVTSNDIVSFERTGPFAGTLTALQSGQSTTLAFGLFHREGQHYDFGPVQVPITVQ